MDQITFDAFSRRTADLLDRRALVGGASAALLAITGIPLSTEAKKRHHGDHKHKKTKTCKKRVQECRKSLLPGCDVSNNPAGCEDVVNGCCKKACTSKDKALDCLADKL